MQNVTDNFKASFWRWIERRAPRADQVALRHKSIYVLPTRQGLGFLLVLALLWVLGTNYENNLVLALTFLLASLLIVSVVHAFKNLSGLKLRALKSHPAFAGDWAEFEILVEAAPQSSHETVHLSWDPALAVEFDLIDSIERHLALAHRARRRGRLRPGRMLVESYYPLGFIRAWSWVYLDIQTLVYPAPRSSLAAPLGHLADDNGDKLSHENQEDFQGFRRFQPGAPLARVAWKHYARGAGMHLKDYTGFQDEQVWLDWEQLQGLDAETRLSQLCYWALELGKSRTQYGLRLPDRVLPPGQGSAHQTGVLRALALYGLPEEDSKGE